MHACTQTLDKLEKAESDTHTHAYMLANTRQAGEGRVRHTHTHMPACTQALDKLEKAESDTHTHMHACTQALDKLEKAESEYNGLMSKRQIVDNDRQCILQVWFCVCVCV
jgi:chromosome segregation ATPase